MNWLETRRRRARWRWAGRATTIGLGAGLLILLVGLLLPSEYTDRRRAILPRPPEAVWRVLTDLDALPRWRSDIRFLERLPDQDGMPAWREDGVHGTRVFVVAEAQPPSHLEVRVRTDSQLGGPVRTFDLTAATPSGTLVTVTDRRVMPNPLERVLARMALGPTGAGALLRDLSARLRQSGDLVSASVE